MFWKELRDIKIKKYTRIEELRDLIRKKKADRDEQIRKYRERRSASLIDGGDAGSNEILQMDFLAEKEKN